MRHGSPENGVAAAAARRKKFTEGEGIVGPYQQERGVQTKMMEAVGITGMLSFFSDGLPEKLPQRPASVEEDGEVWGTNKNSKQGQGPSWRKIEGV